MSQTFLNHSHRVFKKFCHKISNTLNTVYLRHKIIGSAWRRTLRRPWKFDYQRLPSGVQKGPKDFFAKPAKYDLKENQKIFLLRAWSVHFKRVPKTFFTTAGKSSLTQHQKVGLPQLQKSCLKEDLKPVYQIYQKLKLLSKTAPKSLFTIIWRVLSTKHLNLIYQPLKTLLTKWPKTYY